MNSDNERFCVAVGRRLREERELLGMTQHAFAQLGGEDGRAMQIFYENCDRFPTTKYFENLSKHGIDIVYILTGIRK